VCRRIDSPTLEARCSRRRRIPYHGALSSSLMGRTYGHWCRRAPFGCCCRHCHPPPHRVISLPRRGFDAPHMLSMGRIRWVREVGAGSYVLGLTLIRRALWLSNLSRGCRICRADVGPVSSSSNPSLRGRIRLFVVESVALRVRVGLFRKWEGRVSFSIGGTCGFWVVCVFVGRYA
jgi:hypothetical protein